MINRPENYCIAGVVIDGAADVEVLEGMPVKLSLEDDDTPGWLEDVREEGEAVLADLHLHPKHAVTPYILERCEKAPQGVGIETYTGGRFTSAVFYNKVIEGSR